MSSANIGDLKPVLATDPILCMRPKHQLASGLKLRHLKPLPFTPPSKDMRPKNQPNMSFCPPVKRCIVRDHLHLVKTQNLLTIPEDPAFSKENEELVKAQVVLKQENNELKQKLSALQAALFQKNRELENLQEVFNEENKELHHENEKLNTENKGLVEQLDVLKEKYDELQEKTKTLECASLQQISGQLHGYVN